MRKTNTQLFGKFISNNLPAFSKSQWRYPAGTLLLCSAASAAYYYAEQSKKISTDKNKDVQPVEIKDRDDASSETSSRGRPMDLGIDLSLNNTALGNKPQSEVWDMRGFREVPGMHMLWRPIDWDNPRDECEARFVEKAKKLGK